MERTVTIKLPQVSGKATARPGGNGKRRTPVVRRAAVMEPLKLKLTDGNLSVNGRRVPIPRGVGRRLTGAALKAVAKVYRGHSLYVSDNGRSTRVRDNDVVEVLPDTKFISRDERHRGVVSQPRYGRD